MYKAIDIARYVIYYCNQNSYSISNLKLQKLLYFIQAHFLLEKDEECFTDNIEAWDFGPVIPNVYYEYKLYGSINIPNQKIYEELDIYPKTGKVEFTKKEINYDIICYADKCLINSLLNRFGDCSSTYLTQISINQKPWINAYVKNGHKIISTDSIKNYFKNNIDTDENCQEEDMRYTIELDKYELNTLKNVIKKAYKEAKKDCEGKTGFDRDMLEDSAFKLLLLVGKLDNIIVKGDKI